jgi:hypothetical protein
LLTFPAYFGSLGAMGVGVGHYTHKLTMQSYTNNRPARLARSEKHNEHMGMRLAGLLLALWKVINRGLEIHSLAMEDSFDVGQERDFIRHSTKKVKGQG